MILNGASYSDTEFFLQQKEVERAWNKPVALALAFHIITFGLSATLPEILDRKPILDEIITVNLVSLPEINDPAPQQKTPAQSVKEKPAEVKKVEPSKAKVQIPQEPEPVPEKLQPIRPVSLKPIKRKVKKTDPKKLAEEKARNRRAKDRQQALARAKREEEKARRAAEEARAALADMIRQKGAKPVASSSARRSTGGKNLSSLVLQHYVSALYDQVQRYWVLPEMRQWDARLETIVFLSIRRDGTVARKFIKEKSKDPFYDQFVMKTLDSALPLPPLPKSIKEPLEVGLRFRPGELGVN